MTQVSGNCDGGDAPNPCEIVSSSRHSADAQPDENYNAG
jgi:hypothetical protein